MYKFLEKKQDGNALLMALMIMSGLVVAGFTLGSVVINELRQSRRLDQAIIAYYAAESGAEKLVFDWRDTRSEILFSSPACNETSSIGWTCDMSTTEPITQLDFSLKEMEVEQIPLYLPNSLGSPSRAESMTIEWQDADISASNTAEPWLEITLLSWDASDGTVNYEDDKEIIKKVYTCSYADVNFPDCDIITMNDFIDTNGYLVRIRPLYDDVVNVRVKFYEFDNGVNDLDLNPFIKRADFTGEFSGVKQGLRVQFPVVSPAASMFDFVLFTEQSLLKAVF
jgi:hypothetical protein